MMKNILQALFILAVTFAFWYSGYCSGKNAYKDVPMISIPREQWEAIERRSVIYVDTCAGTFIMGEDSTIQYSYGN